MQLELHKPYMAVVTIIAQHLAFNAIHEHTHTKLKICYEKVVKNHSKFYLDHDKSPKNHPCKLTEVSSHQGYEIVELMIENKDVMISTIACKIF